MLIAIPQKNIETFRLALQAFNAGRIPYAIGGAFAMYHYSGMWRNTNDLDLYLHRASLAEAVDILSNAGFRDCGEQAAGDREWIHHAVKDDVIVDLIWDPPNHMAPMDACFHARAEKGYFLGLPVRFLPADGLIWTKIFTMNRHRCDWPDVFNIVRAKPDSLDWEFLRSKMGDNWPVLLSFILLFEWVYPNEESAIPDELRDELLAKARELKPLIPGSTRESMLDPWIYSRPVSP